MNKTLLTEIKGKTDELYKKGHLRLIGITAILFVIIYASLSLITFSYFVSIILFYLALPVVFAIALEVYGLIANLRNKKLNLSEGFKLYFGLARGMFRAMKTVLICLIITMVSRLVCSMAGVGILSIMRPDIIEGIMALDFTNIEEIQEFVASHGEVFNTFYLIIDMAVMIPVIIYAASETRKYEMAFYCTNYLITGNKTRIAPSPVTTLIFRREIFPTIKKEFRNANFRLNWLGYLLFFLAYIGGGVLAVYIGLDYTFSLVFPLLFALVVYLPFYSYTRIFDSVFVIAYADEMISRVSDEIRATIDHARADVDRQSKVLKQSVSVDVKEKYFVQEGGIFISEEERQKFEEEEKEEGNSDEL